MSAARSASMKRRAKAEFEAWADSYDRSLLNRFLFHPAYTLLMEEIARWHTEHARPFCVLDIGCGTGTLAGWLSATDWPVATVGLDYAAGMCREAAIKAERAGIGHRARFIAGDSEHLPFPDASFDVVTCSNSFHHYPHQQAVVNEMHRVLAPGGRLILIDGFRDNAMGWVVFDQIITRVEGHVYHAPWPVVDTYFRQAGFQNIRRRKINFWFPLLATIGDA
jgi:ubiquinone/menaquinone biosynthesis C-methylase UbiE